MRARVLVDNISRDFLSAEWGLSLYIEYKDHKILLDAGTTDAFLKNAVQMNVDLANVDFGVLSHAHYDHADGIKAFFSVNPSAKFYVRGRLRENCYGKKGWRFRYNGIQKGLLKGLLFHFLQSTFPPFGIVQ